MEPDVHALRRRAEAAARNGSKLMRDLIQIRHDNGLSQQVVADRMNVSQSAVAQLERYDANPTLLTMQRYALAVGARVGFDVINEEKLTEDQSHVVAAKVINAAFETKEPAQVDWRLECQSTPIRVSHAE